MRNIVKIFFIPISAMLCSCQAKDNTIAHDVELNKAVYPIAHRFEYSGHRYITFKYNQVYGVTTLHDPDCECKNE